MKKILIVEDEKILREMYVEKLSREGFKVSFADNAREGLNMVKKERPDLVVLDILLPEENGVYFLEKLRNDTKTSKIKVVAFSNYDGADTKKEAKKWKIEDYLIKTDYTPNQMVKKLKKYLG